MVPEIKKTVGRIFQTCRPATEGLGKVKQDIRRERCGLNRFEGVECGAGWEEKGDFADCVHISSLTMLMVFTRGDYFLQYKNEL